VKEASAAKAPLAPIAPAAKALPAPAAKALPAETHYKVIPEASHAPAKEPRARMAVTGGMKGARS
jgi:hypothetical protein